MTFDGNKRRSTLSQSAQLMAEFGITYNGRLYLYDAYRYESLADAVSYARLQRAQPSGAQASLHAAPPEAFFPEPDEAQRAQMAALAITFEGGAYRLGPYRYDRLADAIDYARRHLQA